jgi:hypothetical protein
MDVAVQRLQLGDVVVLRSEGDEVEATVVRPIERTGGTVLVLLRADGREEFAREWPLGELVTVVRGP